MCSGERLEHNPASKKKMHAPLVKEQSKKEKIEDKYFTRGQN